MKIPKIIHFIWAGGINKLPDPNIQVIAEWSRRNPNFKIWIWIDRKTTDIDLPNFYRQRLQKLAPDINLRNIKYKDIEDKKVSSPYIRYEIDRLRPNYGASSDLLRYRILHKYGGAYFDSDVAAGTQPLWEIPTIRFDEPNHQLYVDPRSQNEFLIGNDTLICTAGNPLMHLIGVLAERNYRDLSLKEFASDDEPKPYTVRDTWLKRTIVPKFAYQNSIAWQTYCYDHADYMEKITTQKTGPGTVRDVVDGIFEKTLELQEGDLIRFITPVRRIPEAMRKPQRELGAQWLKRNIVEEEFDIAIQKALDTLAFEVNHLGMLRLDSHITDVAESSDTDVDEVIPHFLATLDRWVNIKFRFDDLLSAQLTYQYPQTEQYLRDRGISPELTQHYFTNLNGKVNRFSAAGCTNLFFLSNQRLPSSNQFNDLEENIAEYAENSIRAGIPFLSRMNHEAHDYLAHLPQSDNEALTKLQVYWGTLGESVKCYQAYARLEYFPGDLVESIQKIGQEYNEIVQIISERLAATIEIETDIANSEHTRIINTL